MVQGCEAEGPQKLLRRSRGPQSAKTPKWSKHRKFTHFIYIYIYRNEEFIVLISFSRKLYKVFRYFKIASREIPWPFSVSFLVFGFVMSHKIIFFRDGYYLKTPETLWFNVGMGYGNTFPLSFLRSPFFYTHCMVNCYIWKHLLHVAWAGLVLPSKNKLSLF